MNNLSVGTFVQNKLIEDASYVAQTRNSAGYAAMIAKVARLTVEEYPALTSEQKASVFATLKHQAKLIQKRTKKYPTMALREAARVLQVHIN